MTTLEMETRLMAHFNYTKDLVIHTVTNGSKLSFEADLLILTPAGYATAVEIKVSKADLRNDLKKNHIVYLDKPMKYGSVSGFEFYYKPLKYFYYAVPKKLEQAALAQIPKFSGLIVVDVEEVKNQYGSYKRTNINVVRQPKLLFKTKWTDREMYNIARLGTMRLPGLKFSILGYQNELKQLRKQLKELQPNTKNYEK